MEATRVYGNLTRSKDTRDFLVESGAWDQLLKFLDWGDQELLCTTVGILVNMMADWDKRVALKEGHGIERYLTGVQFPLSGTNYFSVQCHAYAFPGLNKSNLWVQQKMFCEF